VDADADGERRQAAVSQALQRSYLIPMSKRQKTRRNNRPIASPEAGGPLPRAAVVLLALLVVAAGGFWWSKVRHRDVSPAAALDPTDQPSPAAAANPAFEKLKGKWVRPDGGYIIEIRSVEPGGKLEATYSNPSSIHVEKAVAIQEGALTRMFIELRDVNYPGSTYSLAYEGSSDSLKGIYYQAALQQQFEVVFERLK
jgi:hypothetical protein